MNRKHPLRLKAVIQNHMIGKKTQHSDEEKKSLSMALADSVVVTKSNLQIIQKYVCMLY